MNASTQEEQSHQTAQNDFGLFDGSNVKLNVFECLLCRTSLVAMFVCFRLELLLQRANKIQNMALECEEKLTLAKNTLQAVSILLMSVKGSLCLTFYTHPQVPA